MADPRGGPYDDRRAIGLGQLESRRHHIHALFDVLRIEHGNLREGREPPRVLFGLRRYGTRIVGDIEHATTLDADVIQTHQGICRHVQPHLLAGEKRAGAGIRRTGQHLERSLLVRRPFDMNVVSAAGSDARGDGLNHLARRRARISGDDGCPRRQRRMGERLVSHEKLLGHAIKPPPCPA